MAKFTVTITDNETGKVESEDTNAIFLVADVGDKGTWNSFRTNCSGLELCALFSSVIELVKKVRSKHKEWWSIAEGFIEFKEFKEGENNE